MIPNLLSFYHTQTNDIKKAIILTTQKLKENYAFVALFSNGTLATIRYHEPLIIGLENDGGYFVSSDILGFTNTENAIYLENEQFVIIDKSDMEIYDFHGESVSCDTFEMPKNIASVQKGEYPHYTIKEISEQTHTISNTIQKLNDEINDFIDTIKDVKNLYFCGSCTSYHVALLAKYLLPKFTGKIVESIIASESKFLSSLIVPDSAFVVISQSGESADALEAANIARNKNAKILSIVNLMTSTLAHESEITIPLNCEPEIGLQHPRVSHHSLPFYIKL